MALVTAAKASDHARWRTMGVALLGRKALFQINFDLNTVRQLLQIVRAAHLLDAKSQTGIDKIDTILYKLQQAGASAVSVTVAPVDAPPLLPHEILDVLRDVV